MTGEVPIPTLHLFLPLDQKLIGLLKSFSPEDWKQPTLAKRWNVKDIAAHLVDGNIRDIALSQNYVGDPPGPIHSYQDLLDYLNRLNADWVKAMKRVSPATLIVLLESTQKAVLDYYYSLDLWAPAIYSVSWAGEQKSLNWFHLARNYTERWHHQQQIREAVGQPGIMDVEFFTPLIQTFMMALPHTYRNTPAPDGTIISVKVTQPVDLEWRIVSHQNKWDFTQETKTEETSIEMTGDIAWKLFTKALGEEMGAEKIKISGNRALGKPILTMVSVMA